MSRTVKPWAGRTDDSVPSKACKQRIVERQDRKCALSGEPFGPKDRIQFDHAVPLWLGGANTEANLQAVLGEPHKRKTKAEAGVRAKVKAVAAKHLGIRAEQPRPLQSKPFAPSPRSAKRAGREVKKLPPRNLFQEAVR